MGSVYYLARPDAGTLFELGKFWRDPVVFFGEARHDHWPSYLLDEASLRARVRATIGDEEDPPTRGWDAYAAELVRRITAFAGGQTVVYTSDARDLINDPPYCDDDDELRVADTAYSSDWGWDRAEVAS